MNWIEICGGGLKAQLLPRGATLRALWVPDRSGREVDVCLGYDRVEDYAAQDGYLGATVGRVANRIAGARFSLNGESVCLTANEGENQLHGGRVGFDTREWAWEQGENWARFTLESPHGEEGYPGNLCCSVTYTLEEGGLTLDYWAVCDRDTPVSLTNHSYFNLAGQDGGRVDDHVLTLRACGYTPIGEGSIPTGRVEGVEGTVFDLRRGVRLGDRLDCPELAPYGGYDHNFVLEGGQDPAARLYCPRTGITMTVTTTLEGVQVYAAGFLTPRAGKAGAVYGKNHALCLETQHFPNAVNQPNFPSPILRAGETWRSTTRYAFRAE